MEVPFAELPGVELLTDAELIILSDKLDLGLHLIKHNPFVTGIRELGRQLDRLGWEVWALHCERTGRRCFRQDPEAELPVAA